MYDSFGTNFGTLRNSRKRTGKSRKWRGEEGKEWEGLAFATSGVRVHLLSSTTKVFPVTSASSPGPLPNASSVPRTLMDSVYHSCDFHTPLWLPFHLQVGSQLPQVLRWLSKSCQGWGTLFLDPLVSLPLGSNDLCLRALIPGSKHGPDGAFHFLYRFHLAMQPFEDVFIHSTHIF